MSFPETHRQGELCIENREEIDQMNLSDCDVGVQVASDGRIWVCVNGMAFLRFKPTRSERMAALAEFLKEQV